MDDKMRKVQILRLRFEVITEESTKDGDVYECDELCEWKVEKDGDII